jgi:hypothetical protein
VRAAGAVLDWRNVCIWFEEWRSWIRIEESAAEEAVKTTSRGIFRHLRVEGRAKSGVK